MRRCKGGLCFFGKGGCTRFDFGCVYSRVVPNAVDSQLCRDHSTGFPVSLYLEAGRVIRESDSQILYDILSVIFVAEKQGKDICCLLTRTALACPAVAMLELATRNPRPMEKTKRQKGKREQGSWALDSAGKQMTPL